MSLGKFFQRAAVLIQESVGSVDKTVDQDFEAKKAQFKYYEKEFGFLYRRCQHYFKELSENSRNWDKVVETSKAMYVAHVEDEVNVMMETMLRCHQDALMQYEQHWVELRDMMTRYDGLIKTMGKRIGERDNARVDFDRARVKWERSAGDAVAEATARASEQQYVERNAVVVEQLDWFLQSHLQHMAALLTSLARATRTFYAWGLEALPQAPQVVTPPPYELPTPQLHHPQYTSVIVASTSPRPNNNNNTSAAPPPPGRPERSGSISGPVKHSTTTTTVVAPSNVQSPPAARLERSSGAPQPNNNNNNNNNPALRPSPYAVKSPNVTQSPVVAKKTAAAAPPPVPKVRQVEMLYDFTPDAEDSEGMPATAGQILRVLEPSEDGDWLLCAGPNGQGYVPCNFCKDI